MSLQPLRDNVFFRRDPTSRTLDSGIIIPEHKRNEPSLYATCVAVGPDAKSGIVPGQRALIGVHNGQATRYEGETLAVIKDENVLAILEDEV